MQAYQNYKLRFVVWLFFVLFFLITTITVLTYGSGYTIHWPSRSIISTGSLLIKTEPTTTSVLVNDQHHSNTPLRITRLLPSTVHVQITKDGYFSYAKRVDVHSKETTFITTTLFKQPVFQATERIPNHHVIGLSSDGSTRLHIDPSSSTLTYYHDNTHNTIHFDEPLALQGHSITWSPDGERAIVGVTYADTVRSEEFIFSRARPDGLTSINTDDYEFKFFGWDPVSPWMIRVMEASSLDAYMHTITKEITWITDHKQRLFANDIMLSADTGLSYTLTVGSDEPITLPQGSYQYLTNHDGTIYLRNTRAQTTVAVRDGTTETLSFETLTHATHDDGELLLYNNSEVWRHIPEGAFQLLTRSSKKISRVYPVTNTGYVLILLDDEAILLEYDGRDTRNTYSLLPELSWQDLTISNDGKTITGLITWDGAQQIITFDIQ